MVEVRAKRASKPPHADEHALLLAVTGFAALTLLALTERFAELPAAAAAYAAAAWIFRR